MKTLFLAKHGYRWTVCLMLFLATTINYLDRQILALVKPILDEQLHWTNAEYGLVNSAFQGAYAVGLIAFGWFVDRFGARIGYALSIVIWSLAAMAHMGVSSVLGFVMARVTLGLGEGGNFPSAIKLCADWFPRKERALATSLFNSGANVGAVAAPLLVPLIALTLGWRAAFFVAGIFGFLWVAAWLRMQTSPETSTRLQPAERRLILEGRNQHAKDARPIAIRRLLGMRQTWSFIVAKFMTDPVWWFFLIWLPDYFKQTQGLDLKESWLHLVTIYSMVTALSVVGGWLPGYLTRFGVPIERARKLSMLLFALCVMPIYFVAKGQAWQAVLLIGFAGAAHQAWSANLFTSVSDMFPRAAVASVTGIGGMAGALGGMLFPVATGYLLDLFRERGDIAEGYSLLFSVCAFAYLCAFVLNHLLAPTFGPIGKIPTDRPNPDEDGIWAEHCSSHG